MLLNVVLDVHFAHSFPCSFLFSLSYRRALSVPYPVQRRSSHVRLHGALVPRASDLSGTSVVTCTLAVSPGLAHAGSVGHMPYVQPKDSMTISVIMLMFSGSPEIRYWGE